MGMTTGCGWSLTWALAWFGLRKHGMGRSSGGDGLLKEFCEVILSELQKMVEGRKVGNVVIIFELDTEQFFL